MWLSTVAYKCNIYVPGWVWSVANYHRRTNTRRILLLLLLFLQINKSSLTLSSLEIHPLKFNAIYTCDKHTCRIISRWGWKFCTRVHVRIVHKTQSDYQLECWPSLNFIYFIQYITGDYLANFHSIILLSFSFQGRLIFTHNLSITFLSIKPSGCSEVVLL